MVANTRQSIAVRLLIEALAEKEAQIRPLLAEADDLRRAIQRLQVDGGVSLSPAVEPAAPEPPAISGMTSEAFVAIVDALDRIKEDEYLIADLKGLTREGVARLVAQRNAGYVTAKAYKKILALSGVLRGTKQITGISSRVLNESQDFEKVWPGLYRLKDYSPNEKEVPSEEKTS